MFTFRICNLSDADFTYFKEIALPKNWIMQVVVDPSTFQPIYIVKGSPSNEKMKMLLTLKYGAFSTIDLDRAGFEQVFDEYMDSAYLEFEGEVGSYIIVNYTRTHYYIYKPSLHIRKVEGATDIIMGKCQNRDGDVNKDILYEISDYVIGFDGSLKKSRINSKCLVDNWIEKYE